MGEQTSTYEVPGKLENCLYLGHSPYGPQCHDEFYQCSADTTFSAAFVETVVTGTVVLTWSRAAGQFFAYMSAASHVVTFLFPTALTVGIFFRWSRQKTRFERAL